MVFVDDDSVFVLHRGLPLVLTLCIAAYGATLGIAGAFYSSCKTLSTYTLATSALMVAAALACEHLRHRNKSLHGFKYLIAWIICACISVLAPLASFVYSLYGIYLASRASDWHATPVLGPVAGSTPCTDAPILAATILCVVITLLATVVIVPTSLWIIYTRMVFMRPSLWWDDYDLHIHKIRWVRTALGDVVPALLIRPASANPPTPEAIAAHREAGKAPPVAESPACTVVYAHGNAADLGVMITGLAHLARHCRCDVVVFDYPGYGLASRSILSERRVYAAAEAVLSAVLATPAANIFYTPGAAPLGKNVILYGRSLGTGVCAYLAALLSDARAFDEAHARGVQAFSQGRTRLAQLTDAAIAMNPAAAAVVAAAEAAATEAEARAETEAEAEAEAEVEKMLVAARKGAASAHAYAAATGAAGAYGAAGAGARSRKGSSDNSSDVSDSDGDLSEASVLNLKQERKKTILKQKLDAIAKKTKSVRPKDPFLAFNPPYSRPRYIGGLVIHRPELLAGVVLDSPFLSVARTKLPRCCMRLRGLGVAQRAAEEWGAVGAERGAVWGRYLHELEAMLSKVAAKTAATIAETAAPRPVPGSGCSSSAQSPSLPPASAPAGAPPLSLHSARNRGWLAAGAGVSPSVGAGGAGVAPSHLSLASQASQASQAEAGAGAGDANRSIAALNAAAAAASDSEKPEVKPSPPRGSISVYNVGGPGSPGAVAAATGLPTVSAAGSDESAVEVITVDPFGFPPLPLTSPDHVPDAARSLLPVMGVGKSANTFGGVGRLHWAGDGVSMVRTTQSCKTSFIVELPPRAAPASAPDAAAAGDGASAEEKTAEDPAVAIAAIVAADTGASAPRRVFAAARGPVVSDRPHAGHRLDFFCSADRIPRVRVPVMISHGLDDAVVPAWHGQVLHALLRPGAEYPANWLPGKGHNDMPKFWIYNVAAERSPTARKVLEKKNEDNSACIYGVRRFLRHCASVQEGRKLAAEAEDVALEKFFEERAAESNAAVAAAVAAAASGHGGVANDMSGVLGDRTPTLTPLIMPTDPPSAPVSTTAAGTKGGVLGLTTTPPATAAATTASSGHPPFVTPQAASASAAAAAVPGKGKGKAVTPHPRTRTEARTASAANESAAERAAAAAAAAEAAFAATEAEEANAAAAAEAEAAEAAAEAGCDGLSKPAQESGLESGAAEGGHVSRGDDGDLCVTTLAAEAANAALIAVGLGSSSSGGSNEAKFHNDDGETNAAMYKTAAALVAAGDAANNTPSSSGAALPAPTVLQCKPSRPSSARHNQGPQQEQERERRRRKQRLRSGATAGRGEDENEDEDEATSENDIDLTVGSDHDDSAVPASAFMTPVPAPPARAAAAAAAAAATASAANSGYSDAADAGETKEASETATAAAPGDSNSPHPPSRRRSSLSSLALAFGGDGRADVTTMPSPPEVADALVDSQSVLLSPEPESSAGVLGTRIASMTGKDGEEEEETGENLV